MRIKMGIVVPKSGTIVHLEGDMVDYRSAIAIAFRNELGLTHRAVKTARASDRAGQTFGHRVPYGPDAGQSI